MKNIYRLISIFMILILVSTGIGMAALPAATGGSLGGSSSGIVSSSIPVPVPPQGFTKDQVNKAIAISTKETQNQTNKTNKGFGPASVTQSGDGMWVIGPKIDTQYYVYRYTTCGSYCYIVSPSLYIPMKTEIWNDAYNPVSNAYTCYVAYYWNYYSNSWTYMSSAYKYTGTDGIARIGFSIPYKTYSDKYYIYEYVSYNGKWQNSYNYVNVGWY